MQVSLMHHTELKICSHAIRTCWQSFEKGDEGGWLTPKVFENPVQIHYATHIKP